MPEEASILLAGGKFLRSMLSINLATFLFLKIPAGS
jgi:hypothetical protein